MESHEFSRVRFFSENVSDKTADFTQMRAIFNLQTLLNYSFSLKICEAYYFVPDIALISLSLSTL